MVFTFLSALLLILSFPKFSVWPLAWFALVPVFYGARRQTKWLTTFFHFYLFGFLFFLASVEWLRHVAYFGWIFVTTAYALYFGLFGLAVHWFWSRKHFFLSLFVLPSLWCVLEWVRAEIPVWGFGWNLLAYSQAFNPTIAGIGSLIGGYGLSWLIVFANLAIFFIFDFELNHKTSKGVNALVGVVSLALIFGIYFTYEFKQTVSAPIPPKSEELKVAVIQGNIPQEQKWDPAYKFPIIQTHEQLTALIAGKGKDQADLILWPEAAYPGFFNVDLDQKRIFALAQQLDTPILLGGLHYIRDDSDQGHYFNSAYLVTPDGVKPERYDKMRLVSFGEYVPWRKFFGFFGLERLAYSLGVSDFEAGKEIKIFALELEKKFSVLICFEDTFPFLARQAVQEGAQFLVVITNDAWFSQSAAPYQHLQASIFRAIENGVPLIRAANTGVSAMITREGTILDRVKDPVGHDTFIAGGILGSVPLISERTFYQKHGYRFPYVCLFFVAAGFVLGARIKHD